MTTHAKLGQYDLKSMLMDQIDNKRSRFKINGYFLVFVF